MYIHINDPKMNIARIIRTARIERGMTQKLTAYYAKMSRGQYCKYEWGLLIPSVQNTIKLCKALKIDRESMLKIRQKQIIRKYVQENPKYKENETNIHDIFHIQSIQKIICVQKVIYHGGSVINTFRYDLSQMIFFPVWRANRNKIKHKLSPPQK